MLWSCSQVGNSGLFFWKYLLTLVSRLINSDLGSPAGGYKNAPFPVNNPSIITTTTFLSYSNYYSFINPG